MPQEDGSVVTWLDHLQEARRLLVEARHGLQAAQLALRSVVGDTPVTTDLRDIETDIGQAREHVLQGTTLALKESTKRACQNTATVLGATLAGVKITERKDGV